MTSNGHSNGKTNVGFEGDESSYQNGLQLQDKKGDLPKVTVTFDQDALDEDDSFWRSKVCRMAGMVGIVCLVGIFIAMCVCAAGHCSDSGSCNLNCENPSWGYLEDDGAECWGECFDVCNGESQSPINLVSSDTKDIVVDLLNITGYERNQNFSMFNNGHTVQVSVGEGNIIQGLGLPSIYEAYQFHVHWGKSSATGSEHTINGRMYPMEIHIVHYNTDYDQPDDAADQDEGLAVLGFMFSESPEDNPALDPIVNKLDQIKYKDDPTVDIGAFVFETLLPDDMSYFYRYPGSLTTPGCFQSVVWTVFTYPIPISERQLDAFRQLFVGANSDDEVPLNDNYRPVQPLNGRTVYFGTNL